MRRMALLAVSWFLLGAQAFASPEENEASARLTAETTEFLDRMLGPGRAKVLVTVEGEVSDVQTQTEVTMPILKLDEQGKKVMPGYSTTGEKKEEKVDYFQKDLETSNRKGGFKVRKIRASVVLDSGLPEATVNAVRRVLPDLLRMDESRGDDLAVLRAPMIPSWKMALMSHALSPENIRALTILAGMALLALLCCMMFYITSMHVVRAFIAELAQRRTAAAQAPPPPGLPEEGAAPGLGPGGIPSLEEEPIDVTEREGETPALGRRFDFLTAKDPAELGGLLANEPTEDLALLFAYLADAHPDLASRVFAALPLTRQGEITSSLVKLTMADPERLAMLENRLRTAVEFGLRGPDRLGRILSRLPPDEREGLLGDLMNRDPAGAHSVEKSLFPFEKIAEFRPEELRRLIVAISYQDWGTALRGAPADLVERILAELPAGTRNLVSEASQGPQPRDKILECRSKILSQVYEMAAKGLIDLNRQGASETI